MHDTAKYFDIGYFVLAQLASCHNDLGGAIEDVAARMCVLPFRAYSSYNLHFREVNQNTLYKRLSCKSRCFFKNKQTCQ